MTGDERLERLNKLSERIYAQAGSVAGVAGFVFGGGGAGNYDVEKQMQEGLSYETIYVNALLKFIKNNYFYGDDPDTGEPKDWGLIPPEVEEFYDVYLDYYMYV